VGLVELDSLQAFLGVLFFVQEVVVQIQRQAVMVAAVQDLKVLVRLLVQLIRVEAEGELMLLITLGVLVDQE
jgi:hypothetical protein